MREGNSHAWDMEQIEISRRYLGEDKVSTLVRFCRKRIDVGNQGPTRWTGRAPESDLLADNRPISQLQSSFDATPALELDIKDMIGLTHRQAGESLRMNGDDGVRFRFCREGEMSIGIGGGQNLAVVLEEFVSAQDHALLACAERHVRAGRRAAVG